MGNAARKRDESPPSYIIHWMLLEGIVGAEAEKEESEMAFVVGQGVISPTDCNHKMICDGLFHRNRNTPTSRLLILNRTLKGQED